MMLAASLDTMVWGVPLTLFLLGILGNLMFSARFLVQWVASERARRSVVPMAFWYLSLAGGLLMLLYGILRQDLVVILGQVTGTFVYLRNVWLRLTERSAAGPP